MAEHIKNLRKTNSTLQKHLNQEKRNVNLIQLPKNVNLTALNLTSLIELALSKQCLNKDSVLYALLCDTVTSLLKAESERVNSQSSKQSRPKGMRFHPVILKWFVELANKCGIGGYNLVREILLIPCLTKVCRMTYLDNLQVFSQELSRCNCKGLGGIHWDEIYIKKGVKVCAKTNELIGFEDVNIPENISEEIDLENQENDSKRDTQRFNNTSELYSLSEESDSSCSDDEESEIEQSGPFSKIILQFFWSSIEGDFTWPVASFPLNKINSKILGNCVWKTINVLSQTRFGK